MFGTLIDVWVFMPVFVCFVFLYNFVTNMFIVPAITVGIPRCCLDRDTNIYTESNIIDYSIGVLVDSSKRVAKNVPVSSIDTIFLNLVTAWSVQR